MPDRQTPLSPHLQIYKPQLTSVLSITHRATGIGLSIASLLLCYWLIAIANGAENYTAILTHIQRWYGITLIVAILFSLYYHLLNGIRHLFWDIGAGLELATAYRSGYAVIIASVLLTAATVYIRISL